MKRLVSILSACALMMLLLAATVSPAIADDGCIGVRSGGECIGVGDDFHDHGFHHGFLNDFDDDDFDDDDFDFDDDDFGFVDDCDFLRFSGGEAIFSCDID